MLGKKILVVEDNEMNMELVCDILEVNGYKVLKAEDAETGIEIAEKEKPDLILMDIQMPSMDGISAAKILKENQATKDIFIVALTASVMKEKIEEILKSGCDGLIEKPIDVKEFQKQVESFLQK